MLQNFTQWLSETAPSRFIQDVLWIIPAVQTVHILAIAIVLSSVAMIELRLFGLVGRSAPLAQTAGRFLPWLWWGTLVLAATGVILITAEPGRALTNPAFQIKMALLLVAIGVTFAFHRSICKHAVAWSGPSYSAGVIRVAALATLLLWFSIAVAGRWIAYTVVSYGGN
jgi:uncharacterized membrane protein SirB2